MKWTKRILLLLVALTNIKNVDASITTNISISTSNTIVGNSGKATLTINANGKHIGQIYGTFDCGGLGNRDLTFVAKATEEPPTSQTYTIDWTAKNTGTYECKVTGLEVGTVDPVEFTTPGVQSKTITVVGNTNNKSNNNSSKQNSTSGTTADKKEYDSDNTLKSLEVENYKINPNFNKDTLDYKLEVDETVEKVNIKASANSDKAEVIGIGEKNLTPGENTIEVKAIAENGNEKIYKILITVKDQHPITIRVNGKNYTVVKKNNNILEKPENYEEEKIKIEDQDVISYINKTTNTRLIILKDENNKPNYYIYNEKTKKCSLYRTITIGSVTLQLIDSPIKLKYYKKYQINLKNEKVDIYKIKESHKVGLIYGTNIKTGNTGYYVYDQNEETLSKYYDEEVKVINNEFLDFKNKAMIFMGVVSGIVIVTITISLCKEIRKKKKRIK